jgi:hypothetical protein
MQVDRFRSIILALTLVAPSTALAAPALAQGDVVAIAGAAAKQHGYDLKKFNPPDARYQLTEKDNTWSVFYQCKGIAPPGCNFMVTVNADTRAAVVHPGK